MSGGVIGFGALLAPAAGALVSIGYVAEGTAFIAVQGGMAAYEQMVVAKECNDAIEKIKSSNKKILRDYNSETTRMMIKISKAEESEFRRLQNKLSNEGYSDDELNFEGSIEDKLLHLLSMEAKNANNSSDIRTPKQIYSSICKIVNPLLATLPKEVFSHKQLQKRIDDALLIMNSDKNAYEKSIELKHLEKSLISMMESYNVLAKKYSYAHEEYIGLSIALGNLAKSCGEKVTIPEFNANEYKRINANLKVQCQEMCEKARAFVRTDEKSIEANKKMAKIVIESIENSGNKVVSVNDKSYGVESFHEFGQSIIKSTISKDGAISIDLMGMTGESFEQIKKDESIFCDKALGLIIQEMKKNGLDFIIDNKSELSQQTVCRLSVENPIIAREVQTRTFNNIKTSMNGANN